MSLVRVKPSETRAESESDESPLNFKSRQFKSSAGVTNSSHRSSPWLLASSLVAVGVVAGVLLLVFGVVNARNDAENQFFRVSQNLVERIEQALEEYAVASEWIYEAYHPASINRGDYSEAGRAVQYIRASGLHIGDLSIVLNITEEERPTVENQTRQFFQQFYPNAIDQYQGVHSCERDHTPQDYFLVEHLLSTKSCDFATNEGCRLADFDLDLRSLPEEYQALALASTSKQKAVSSRIDIRHKNRCEADSVEPRDHDHRRTANIGHLRGRSLHGESSVELEHEKAALYAVKIVNPGLPTFLGNDLEGFYSIVEVDIPDMFAHIHWGFSRDNSLSVYMFDITEADEEPVFVGGAGFKPHAAEGGHSVDEHDEHSNAFELEEEKTFADVQAEYFYTLVLDFSFGQRVWRFVSAAPQESFDHNTEFVIVTTTLIVVISLGLALWIATTVRRQEKIREMQRVADSEKTALVIESANNAAKKEHEMNEYLSHEVRNPLAAAISACTFVEASLKERDLEAQRGELAEDVEIINNSLYFINDLLRTLLDWQRAAHHQIKIEFAPVDIKQDVLQPAASMLYHRGHNFELVIDCSDNLVVEGDRLRLKQIVLNLGRNALKFVESGFVRLRAGVVDGLVEIYVEDSGPGIPLEKQKKIFTKFQESLDSLSQGTGVGLALCQKLVDFMGGDMSLDTTYHSGLEGQPGACFKISLGVPPLPSDRLFSESEKSSSGSFHLAEAERVGADAAGGIDEVELPKYLSVLFVDDEIILRKLFSRTILRVAPTWEVKEAGNGETALRLAESQTFDVIFLDQYMSSVDRQLLGTETARALRAQGYEGCICGLSANDIAQDFLRAGANSFLQKPIPGKHEEVVAALQEVLRSRRTDAKGEER